MAELLSLLPDIKPDVPTAPDLTIQRHLILTGIEFFRESEIWKSDLEPIALVEGQDTYSLNILSDTRATRLIKATVENHRDLTHNTTDEINRFQRLAPSEGTPTLISFQGSSISVWPKPDHRSDGKVLHVRVGLVPQYISVTLPDELLEEWRLALVYGAKAKLFLSSKKEWSDPNLSAFYQQQFRSEIQRAKAKSIDEAGAKVRVANRFFAGSRRTNNRYS